MVNPTIPPSAPVRDWSFIVLKVDGHGLAADIRASLDTLDKNGTSPAAYITVRAEQQGKVDDFALSDGAADHHLTPARGGLMAHDTKNDPVLSADSMSKFLVNAMTQYPAKHYVVSLDGHSHALRQVVGPIHQALAAAMQASGQKIDILVLDACFMAQAEFASEFKDVAHILVASEEAMSGSRQVDQLAQDAAKSSMDATAMARKMVERSSEFTLSALDLEQCDAVETKLAALAGAIEGVTDEPAMQIMRHEIEQAQHFYTPGLHSASPFHNTVDVVDFTTRLAQHPTLAHRAPAVAAAARDVADELRRGPFVIGEKHVQTVTRTPTLDFYDVTRAHGVSMYLPVTAPILRDRYTQVTDSPFNRSTRFDSAIAHLTGDPDPAYRRQSARRNALGWMLFGGGLALSTAKEKAAAARQWVHEEKEKRA